MQDLQNITEDQLQAIEDELSKNEIEGFDEDDFDYVSYTSYKIKFPDQSIEEAPDSFRDLCLLYRIVSR